MPKGVDDGVEEKKVSASEQRRWTLTGKA